MAYRLGNALYTSSAQRKAFILGIQTPFDHQFLLVYGQAACQDLNIANELELNHCSHMQVSNTKILFASSL